jgi:hypothetical protein
MRLMRPFDVAIVALVFALVGCADQGTPSTESQPSISESNENLTAERKDGLNAGGHIYEFKKHAIGTDFAQIEELPHGIDGDSKIVFVAEPLHGRVAVLDRFTGQELGSIPAPPGGFILPFSLRVPSEGHLVVLDPGGFPDPNVPTVARVYDYEYSYSHSSGLSATISNTTLFDTQPVIFAEDVEVLDDGSKLVAESILGQIWMIHPDGHITSALGPRTLAPEDAVPELAPCINPPTTVDGIPFGLTGSIAPGVISLAHNKDRVYFGATCAGGIHSIPIASLTDDRENWERASDIDTVTPKLGDVDLLHGLAFNRWKNQGKKYIYAADSVRTQLIRVNIHNGKREVLGNNTLLYNFPVSLQFLPPVAGITPLVVSSDQEHRFAAINGLIDHDMFESPFRLTKVLVLP